MNTETITLTKKDIDAMEPEKLQELLLKATDIHATACVTGVDGKIKYDDVDTKGSFGEKYLET